MNSVHDLVQRLSFDKQGEYRVGCEEQIIRNLPKMKGGERIVALATLAGIAEAGVYEVWRTMLHRDGKATEQELTAMRLGVECARMAAEEASGIALELDKYDVFGVVVKEAWDYVDQAEEYLAPAA